jgi:hypothetical protein
MGKFPKSPDDKRESEKPLPSLHLFVSFLFIAAGGAVVSHLDREGARKLSCREAYQQLLRLYDDLFKESVV